MELGCEHGHETDISDARVVLGNVVRWECADGFEHECGVDEL